MTVADACLITVAQYNGGPNETAVGLGLRRLNARFVGAPSRIWRQGRCRTDGYYPLRPQHRIRFLHRTRAKEAGRRSEADGGKDLGCVRSLKPLHGVEREKAEEVGFMTRRTELGTAREDETAGVC